MKQLVPLLFCLFAAGSFLQAEPLSYTSLLAAARSSDRESEQLSLNVQKAEHQLQLHETRRGQQQWSLSSSQLGLSSPYSWSLAPGFSYTKAESWSLDISTQLSGAFDQAAAPFLVTPTARFSIPLWQRNYHNHDTLKNLRQQLDEAWLQAARRSLSLERELIGKLGFYTNAEGSLQKAISEEAKAIQNIDKARRLDGARDGGTVMLSLQRQLASCQSNRRRAEIQRRRALQDLSDFCGLEISDGFTLSDLPESRLQPETALLEHYPAYRTALDRIAHSRQLIQRPDEGAALRAEAGADLELEPGSSATPSPRLQGGINYSDQNTQAALTLRWDQQRGPSLDLSFTWKPQDSTTDRLKIHTDQLALAEAELQYNRDLHALNATIAELEKQREDLMLQEEDLRISLDFAREQLKIYTEWMDRGVVDKAELAEVTAALAEIETQSASLNLDKRLWELSRQELWLQVNNGVAE